MASRTMLRVAARLFGWFLVSCCRMGGTLLANPEQGFWLNFQPGKSEPVHEFCGPNEIESARCPNCAKPLLRILSLSAADSRLNLALADKVAPSVHVRMVVDS
jgi:hypothetical protein